jgi:HSF-type DNA-binding
MHAILSRQDFAGIISWLPHGRAWRILKPRDFEVKVIPMFFEHSKFSSFVRQANGWGFRRITQGRDRGAYYHEQFLRGLPFLSKTMKRPGPNEKKTADPYHEPDLYKISEEHPVPEKADDDAILLNSTLQGGPKARVPVYWGSTMSATANAAPCLIESAQATTPTDQMAFSAFQRAMGASELQVISNQAPISPMQVSPQTASSKPMVTSIPSFLAFPVATSTHSVPPMPQGNHFAALAAANQMALQIPTMNVAAASHFAAGFAAATAFTQQHYSAMVSSMQQSMHQHAQQTQQVQQPGPQEPVQYRFE